MMQIRGGSRASFLAIALVAALIVVAVAAPLRGAASGDATVIRPDRFVPITVEAQLSARNGMALLPKVQPFDLNLIGTPVDQSPPQRIVYPSVAAAAEDFRPRPRVPAALPPHLEGEPEVALLSASSSGYLLDLPKMQRLLADAGLPEIQLPTTMHGARVNVDVPAALTMRWGTGQESLVLTQLRQPRVTVPGEVDLPGVREMLLGHPRVEGLSSDTVAQLRGIEQWQTTVPVPVPSGAVGEPVRVDGADGLLLTHGHQDGAALVWQRNGVVYTLMGPLDPADLRAVADSLR
jgi:hypothetical protein